MAETELASVERIVAGFCRSLRAGGLAVPVGTAIIYAEALAAVLNTTLFAQPAICSIQENKP